MPLAPDMRKTLNTGFLLGLLLTAAAFTFTANLGARAESPAGQGTASLVPHKAVYEIKMISRRSSAQILNISGQMLFNGNTTCEAWTTDHKFKLLYEYADAPAMNIHQPRGKLRPHVRRQEAVRILQRLLDGEMFLERDLALHVECS